MISDVVDHPQTDVAGGFPDISQKLEQELIQVFKLLADETRLRILLYLMKEGELHVSALCDRLDQSQPAVSHHLALLRVAELLNCRRDGKHNFYSVRKDHFQGIVRELFDRITTATDDSQVRFADLIVSQDGNA
jgi:ArsR family transcriptional regulator